MKNILKIFEIVICAAIILCSLPISSIAETNGGQGEYFPESIGVLRVENTAAALELNTETGQLAVLDMASGTLWRSNPQNASDDEIATGIMRTNLRAQLIVESIENNSRTKANNLVSSINRDGASYKIKNNSITAVYEFVNEEFTVPVRYSLTEKGFIAEVLLSEISERGSAKINTIQLLPFFGSGGAEDEGYLLVPDGSGAIINFNNGKHENEQYEKSLYGGDLALEQDAVYSDGEKILLPLFGIKKNKAAFAAIITGGAELAKITAAVSGSFCGYNRIFSSVTYREAQTISLKDHSGSNVSSLFIAPDIVSLKEYKVEYIFLNNENANYTGMARAAGDWLAKQGLGGKISTGKSLFADIYGAAEKEKAFLGIRYTGTQTLTTFAQARGILDELKERGISAVTTGYRYFDRASVFGKITDRLKPSYTLGGVKQYKKLLDAGDKTGAEIYPEINFTSFIKSGGGYSALSTSILGLDLSSVKRYPYSKVTNAPDKNQPPSYFTDPSEFNKSASRLIKTGNKNKITNIMLTQSAGQLYSDFSRGALQRDRMAGALAEAVAKIKSTGFEILTSAPNAYLMPLSSKITDLPLYSSKYLLFDGEAPVLQIALSSLVEYSGQAVNFTMAGRSHFLRLLETGSSLKLALMNARASDLIGTKSDYLFSANYKRGAANYYDWYDELAAAAGQTENSAITGHERDGEVVRVIFRNGTEILINYSENELIWREGTILKPLSYQIREGDSGAAN